MAACLALLAAAPGLAQQAATDAPLTRFVRIVGEMDGGPPPVGAPTHVILFGGPPDAPAILEIRQAAELRDLTALPAGTHAVLRMLPDTDTGMPGASERAFFERTGVPLFVMRMAGLKTWEIGRQDGVIAIRTIGDNGVAGAWKAWPVP